MKPKCQWCEEEIANSLEGVTVIIGTPISVYTFCSMKCARDWLNKLVYREGF